MVLHDDRVKRESGKIGTGRKVKNVKIIIVVTTGVEIKVVIKKSSSLLFTVVKIENPVQGP